MLNVVYNIGVVTYATLKKYNFQFFTAGTFKI